ncbi:class I SAM-dependent methyltransferase [Kribbella sp. CA-294648]|uniref:class I SAM-dependent methyltransferase n=1 Tax=Kribbella sp. CA-294648 TaxID=3239948 RepID=UPI003D930D5E
MKIVKELEGSGGLAAIARMTEAIAALETRRTELIEQLRSQRRASWEEIGQACGMTRQGASRRWSRQAHAASFGAAAAAYRRGRPPYPESAVDWLIPRTARSVLDLGAGTGKLTQLLVDRDVAVTAVEPLAAMREELVAAAPSADVRDGWAEAIPLENKAVDAVVVAQAWHWFDPAKALPEIARVLTPGGTLGLVWNVRDHSVPWVAELDRVLHRHTRQEIDTRPSVGTPFREVERLEVRWEHALTRDELLDLVASRSYVITMPRRDRDELMHQVTELLDSHLDLRGRKKLTMPYVTRCTRARLAP